MDILPVFHTDKNHQRSYFEGPYIVKADELVGEGKLLGYKKSDIAYELQWEFDFYCPAYLSDYSNLESCIETNTL